MSEKNFKIASGLETGGDIFVPINANITWNIGMGNKSLTGIGLSGDLQWGGYNLATEQYVTDAIGNINVPDAYITSIGQSSPFLTVGQGALDVSLGNGLEANLANNTLQLKLDANGGFAYNEGRLKVKPWNGITVNDNGVAVNTSYVANAIAGSGLELANGQIAVDTDTIATKAYADSIAAGLDIKKAVHLATSEDITIGNVLYAGNTFDGHVLQDGERILVKDQTNSYENGIYAVSLAGAARATDADSWEELNKGTFVFVESGTHAGHGFVVTTATTTETFGQQGSSIEFTQFSDAGSFITSTANVFTVTGGNLDVNLGVTLAKSQTGPTTWGLEVDTSNIAGSFLTAVGNTIEVNTTALASQLIDGGGVVGAKGLKSGAIDGTLGVDAGDGLSINQISGSLQVNLSPRLEINQLDGSIDLNQSEVTSMIGSGLDGQGLTYNGETLNVNTQYVAGALSSYGAYGITDNQGVLGVNTIYLAGEFSAQGSNGITASQGVLGVNLEYVASNLDGTGLTTEQGTLAINTTYVSMALQGTGLTYNSGNDKLGVDTQYIANTIAGSNLELSVIDNKLKLVDSPTIAGTLTVTGDLVVNGSTTTLNTTTLEVEDNLIVLNKNVTGTPLTNAGIEVERGNLTNASLYFDEEADQWKAHNGTSIITLGSSFITSIGQGSPFLDVTAGELNLSAGAGLTANFANNKLEVAISQGGGLAFDAPADSLKVDYVAVATRLAGSGLTLGAQNDTLQVWTSGAIVTNQSGKVAFDGSYVAGTGLVWDAGVEMLQVNPYGATTKYDGADSNSSSGSSVVTMVTHVSPNSNTYESVGTFPSSADAFEAFVTIRDEGGSKMRTSKLVGTLNTSTFEYTEFGIVEIGQPIADVDVDLYYDGSNNIYSLRVKGTGSEGNIKAVAEVKYITVA